MTTEEKRKALNLYCEDQLSCASCPFTGTNCFFSIISEDNPHYMTDAEIDVAYGVAFHKSGIEMVADALEQLTNTEEPPHIKDSGIRREFDTGAVRDIQEGKGRCDLMPLDVVGHILSNPTLAFIHRFQTTGIIQFLTDALTSSGVYHDAHTMFLEVAKHFEEGAKKYGENNWQKGLPVSCYIDSAVRHYLKYLRGDTDEPHDRAFCWNIMCAIWTCRHKPELNSYSTKPVTPNENLCVCCGTSIPEGWQVCPKCMNDGK